MNSFSKLTGPATLIAALASGAALILTSGCNNSQPDTRAAAPASSVGTVLDDGIITTKVKSALLADPEIKSFDPKVETRSGEVLLSGFVGNQSQVDRAIAATRAVEGVKIVTNKMEIKDGVATVGNTLDDGVITAKVKASLLADPNVKSLDIAVVTRKGEIQLSGFVDNGKQIDRATELARAVEGVKSVSNEMSIKK